MKATPEHIEALKRAIGLCKEHRYPRTAEDLDDLLASLTANPPTEELTKSIAYDAWTCAANSFRLYPENKHTFATYWDGRNSYLKSLTAPVEEPFVAAKKMAVSIFRARLRKEVEAKKNEFLASLQRDNNSNASWHQTLAEKELCDWFLSLLDKE